MRYLLRTAILLLVLRQFAVAAEPETPMSTDQAFEKLASYDCGQDDKALHVLELHVGRFATNSAHKAVMAQRLADMLGRNETSKAAKIFICKQLVVVGTDAQVPILAEMLDDPETAEIARYTLDAIPGEISSAALRAAVERLSGNLRIGAINSLGVRRDAKSVSVLAGLLSNSDPQVTVAVAEALGKIGTAEAAVALTKAKVPDVVRSALHNAQLQCAERLAVARDLAGAAAMYQQVWASDAPASRRVAGLVGLANVAADQGTPLVMESLDSDDSLLRGTAVRLAGRMSGANVTATLVKRLDKLDADQVLVLGVLAERADSSAASAVAKRMNHEDQAVRIAAINAMGSLGDASTVEPLAKVAATSSGAIQYAARTSLTRLVGEDVDAKLIAMAAEGDSAVRMEAFRALAGRSTSEATSVLIKSATDEDANVRMAAFDALAAVAQADSYAKLVELLLAATAANEASAAERAVVATGNRLDESAERLTLVIAALGKATAQAKVPLLRVLGGFGGAEALGAVRAQVADTDPTVQDAAVRAMAGWPDASASGDLLKLAEGSDNPIHRVLALRGYMRLVREVKEASTRLKMLDAVLPIANTVQSKQMLLAALSEVADPGALHVATKFLDDGDVHAEAAVATLKIARAAMLADPAAVRVAMLKLMDATEDKAVSDQAAALDEEAKRVPTPSDIQRALRHDKKRSDANKTALAKRSPKGYRLACYLDCGPDTVDGDKDGPLLRMVAGTPYIWGDSLRAADARFGSIFFDSQLVVFEAAGLDPKKSYQIGFTWWDYDHNTRAQSVSLATGEGEDEAKVLEKTKLPSGANKQDPEERTATVPAKLYSKGSLRIGFHNESTPNVVVSELWLWEGDAEKD